jgi:methyl-accepting chemotaxis protein
MSFLSRFRVLTKILTIVGFLSAIAAVIAAIGATSLRSLSDATDTMEAASNAALLATRMNVNVVKINGAEFRVAADPRPETVREVADLVAAEKKLFLERFAAVEKNLASSEQQRLREVEALWTA